MKIQIPEPMNVTNATFNGDSFNEVFNAKLCADLRDHGWFQHNLFLSSELNARLAEECLQLRLSDQLKPATIGQRQQRSLHTNIRSDQIGWLHSGQSRACDAYLLMMEQLRLTLNQTLYLGLEDYESHFSFYETGTFYSKHLDRFHHHDARTVSVVIYLNDDWLAGQGGALRLHPHNLATHDIAPLACRLVVFLSAEMLHEVLPATRNRMSLTGWFRRRTNT